MSSFGIPMPVTLTSESNVNLLACFGKFGKRYSGQLYTISISKFILSFAARYQSN